MNLDTKFFSIIHGLSGQSQVLDQIGIFFADQFMYVFIAGVFILGFVHRYRANAILAFANVFVSRLVVVEIIKRIIARPRPFEVLPIVNLVPEDLMRSFPSGHTVIYFSLAFAFRGTRLFWPFILLALIGSLARIYVGVHYPSDLLGSLVIAAVVAVVMERLFKKLKIG